MKNQTDRSITILKALGGAPATPFREDCCRTVISEVLNSKGIEHSQDAYGNILARNQGNSLDVPPIAFVAHMDHPGFELTEADGSKGLARSLGGIPIAALTKPTPVVVINPDSTRVNATAFPHNSTDPTNRRSERIVTIEMDHCIDAQLPLSVVFDLPDFELDGEIIRMRALDDLAGCAAVLTVLERTAGETTGDVYGVFTCAEEEGLLGARLLAEKGSLPTETIIISVEASSLLPGVKLGGGPVIRVGDAMSTFDASAERVLMTAVDSLRERDKDFKFQRRLMYGGVCEATAFKQFGYSVTGAAFPLGNYHNSTTYIDDPNGSVGAEFINLNDFLNGVELLTETSKSVCDALSLQQGKWIDPVPDNLRQRLMKA